MQLTEQQFWDDYWAQITLPSRVDYKFSFERCLAKALKAYMPSVHGDVFEVGCAPGKWLTFMAEEFGLIPHGIDYSQAGMQATLNNFKMLNLQVGDIIAGDFFQVEPQQTYDAVMSFGFIEHFTDVDSVVERHLQWLKPGGVLVLGVPNFNGIYHYLQKKLGSSILENHNLDIMNLAYFESIANKFKLKKRHISYLGSFEPSLPIVKNTSWTLSNIVLRGILKLAFHLRKVECLDSMNHAIISAYILAIYES